MDFISNKAIEISTLALDGLSARHKALASNIANADTPGYKRVDVKFEDQLGKILRDMNIADAQKIRNSMGIMYNPTSLDELRGSEGILNQSDLQNPLDTPLDVQEEINKFKPEIANSDSPAIKLDGNNVSMEYEMAELAKNGMKYTAITTMQERMFTTLKDVIQRGGGS